MKSRTVYLDGTRITSKVDFLDAIATALDFPSYFGRNWDALVDCLRDIETPVEVVWTDAGRYAAADPGGYATAIEILEQTDAVTVRATT
jgi:RNAse (barnase) inhibitor barstar